MRLLHTSDWHIGQSLGICKRWDEFEAFLSWLSGLLEKERFDVLLIAGDIFDNGSPSNRSRELYYRFLGRAAKSKCAHIIVVGGNHDSPAFLNAPKHVLEALNITIIGGACEKIEDEIIPIFSGEGKLEGVVCAVPYLRDCDIREDAADQDWNGRIQRRNSAVEAHYESAREAAEKLVKRLGYAGGEIPIIASGHLFARGAKFGTESDDNALVGNICATDAERIVKGFDYLALGHIHTAQMPGKSPKIAYSGSPLALSFGINKERVLLDVQVGAGILPKISRIPVPQPRELEKISGKEDEILARLRDMKRANSNAIVDIECESDNPARFRKLVDETLQNSQISVCRISNKKAHRGMLESAADDKPLDSMSETEVFGMLLDSEKVPEQEREELMSMYSEILKQLSENGEQEL